MMSQTDSETEVLIPHSRRPPRHDDDDDDDDRAMDSPRRARARKRVVTVEPVALLYVCFLNMSQPLTSQYVYSQMAEQMNYTGHSPGSDSNDNCTVVTNTSSPEYLAQNAVQEASAKWMIGLNVAQSLPTIFSTLLLTGYCDRSGRKLPMLLPIVGITLRSIICLVVVWLNLHVGYLVLGCLIDGLFGGAPCVFMAIFSFLADVTTREQRTFRVLVVELAVDTGGCLALLAGGYIIDSLGFLYPFAIMLGINILNILYTFFFIPETIVKVPGTKIFSLSHTKDTLKVYCKQDPATKRRGALLLCLAVMFTTNLVLIGKQDCEVYHLLANPLCWKSAIIGLFQATVMVVGSVSSLVTTALFQRRLGDNVLMLLGCLSGVAYEVMFGLATTTTVVFLTPLVGQWYLLIVPMVRSVGSKLVQSHEQGAMFAGISIVQLVSVMIGFTAFDTIYQATLETFSGTVFMVMAGCFLLGAVFSTFLLVLQKLAKRQVFSYGPILTVTDS